MLSNQQLREAVSQRQYWMVDFIVGTTDAPRVFTLGEALNIAARNGDSTTLDKLLMTGVHPDSGRDAETGRSALTIASEHWGASGSPGHFQVLISLLRRGADSAQVDSLGRSLLMWAALRANARLLRLVLHEGSKTGPALKLFLDLQDLRGRTALMDAVATLDETVVEMLLAAGADADLMGQPGAVAHEEDEAEGLFEKVVGADDLREPQTALAMLSSICTGFAPSFLVTLVEQSTKLLTLDDHNDTFLLWACRWGHADAVRVALERFSADELGANVEPPEGGNSPLELAFMCRRHAICLMLVREWQRGLEVPDTRREGDYIGIKTLKIAIDCGWQDVALQIIETITPFDPLDPVVTEAVHEAITRRWRNCLGALLARKVPPTVKTVKSAPGDHPAVTACKYNDLSALNALIAAGAANLELACIVAVWLGHIECFKAIWKVVNRSSDLVRASACVAALTDAVEALKMVNKEARFRSVRVHTEGRKVEECISGWCSARVLHRAVPSLFRVIKTEHPSIPLLCAVSKGHYNSASHLLENGADPSVTDEAGLTSMQWACMVGQIEIVKLLVKSGAQITPSTPSLSFSDLRKAYQLRRLHEGRNYLSKQTDSPQSMMQRQRPEDFDLQLAFSPIMCALLKGHANVVALLVEAGASTLELMPWCDLAVVDEPRFAPIARAMLSIALRYEDFKSYGPFGVVPKGQGGVQISTMDISKVPSDGILHAIVAQFSPADWSIVALQFIHQYKGEIVECEVHKTNRPHAGDFQGIDQFMHLERLEMGHNEYVMQVEVAINHKGVESLRFTTNHRVCKWLGEASQGIRDPELPPPRIVTVHGAGREVVGMFTTAGEEINLIGFMTRLRIEDIPWRNFRTEETLRKATLKGRREGSP